MSEAPRLGEVVSEAKNSNFVIFLTVIRNDNKVYCIMLIMLIAV